MATVIVKVPVGITTPPSRLAEPFPLSNTKLQDSIYFRGADHMALYVNLFIPSTLTWPERKVVVRQVTDFPCADTTRLVVEGSGRFDIKVRVPRWASRGFFVTIELRMPFGFYLDRVVDQPNVASIFYGPVLLAAE